VTEQSSWTAIARLIKPQGRRGEIIADILTDFPERFETLRTAFLSRGQSVSPISIEQAWLHKGRVVLKFEGVDSISAAETLRSAELVVPRSERVPLDADAAYVEDLAGCELIDVAQPGSPSIGIIRDVIQQADTTDLLVVIASDGAEHWIPFARAYVSRMDLEARRLEMNLPAGLLEINAPLTEEEKQEAQPE
jgi:16S rRNA processing protein RimM